MSGSQVVRDAAESGEAVQGDRLPPTRDVQLDHAKNRGDEALTALLSKWRDEVRIRANAQQLAAVDDARNNLMLGIAVTVLAAIGASGILTGSPDSRVTTMAGR